MAIESLGGYRLVRKLGEGPRAEVFLAHPHRVADDAIPAAIKIFRSGVPESEISREIEALSRGSGEHTVALLDLTTGPTGAPALILSRCASGSVARLIATRTDLFVGEAVTILAPIVGAVGRLHDAGVAHGAIRPEAVLFDVAGAPILGCFGHAVILTPGLSAAAREAEPALTTDLGALKQLVLTVLDRVGEDAAAGAVDWLGTSEPGDPRWLDALLEQLFMLGDPTAVDLRRGVVLDVPVIPARLLKANPVHQREAPADDRLTVLAGLVLPDFVARVLPARLVDEGLWPLIRSVTSRVRRRFWVAIGAVAAMLLIALAVVPQGRSDAVPPTPPTTPPSAAPSAEPTPPSAILGDDPIAAAVALLTLRESCIQTMSVLCLDGVIQQDSAAAAADRTLVRDIQDGREVPAPWRVRRDQLAVDERLGDTAIVSLGDAADDKPASLLLMKSEAGWRIRDYLP